MGYVVKQRWLSGKGKKMWQSGDIVTEKDFPENFQILLKEGRIIQTEDSPEEIKAKKEAEKARLEAEKAEKERLEAEAKEQAENDAEKQKEEDGNKPDENENKEPLFIYEDEAETIKVFHESDLNKKQVIKHLAKLQIPFNPADKKEPLFNLILSHVAKA